MSPISKFAKDCKSTIIPGLRYRDPLAAIDWLINAFGFQKRCDAIYATAKAAGATIADELTEKSHGGKGFSCRDLEGHLWHFGTYDPWQVPPQN